MQFVNPFNRKIPLKGPKISVKGKIDEKGGDRYTHKSDCGEVGNYYWKRFIKQTSPSYDAPTSSPPPLELFASKI